MGAETLMVHAMFVHRSGLCWPCWAQPLRGRETQVHCPTRGLAQCGATGTSGEPKTVRLTMSSLLVGV